MAENKTQASHVTQLDFDLSKMESQLQEVSKMSEKMGIEANQKFKQAMGGKVEGFEKFEKEAEKITKKWDGTLKDLGKQTTITIPKIKFENLEEAKGKLVDFLKVQGEISKQKFEYEPNTGMLRSAQVEIEKDGRKLIEIYNLQKQAIGEVTNGVQNYRYAWVQTSAKVTDDIAKKNKILKQEEQQIKRNTEATERQRNNTTKMYADMFDAIDRKYKREMNALNAIIEKEKDRASKYSASADNSETAKKSQELIKQLEIIKKQVEQNKVFTETEKSQTQAIIEQSNELKRQANIGTSGMKEMVTSTSNHNNTLKDSIRLVSQLMGAYSGVFLLRRGVSDTVTSLKEVELAVVEITRVLNDNSLNIEHFTNRIFDTAIAYGQSFDNAVEVTKRFAQAGYSADESLSMMEKTMLALNTAELNMEQSTQSLIGIMQQWGIEASQYGLLIDKINITADNFAVTSQDIVDGLLRAGSAAKNAKFSFDETVGALVAMKEASGRAGKEVGNALNSLISYMQRNKTLDVFESMGIKVWADEAKTSLVPLMDVWGQLSQKVSEGGEDIIYNLERQTDMSSLMNEEVARATDTMDQYNEVLEIQNTLQKDGITDIEKKTLYEQAGTHRRNYFIALLKNFNKIQEVTNNLQNAEGYSIRENAKYMETLQAKYQQFLTSLKAMAQQAGQSGLMELSKGALDAATAFIQFTNGLGGLNTVLKTTISLMILLNRQKIANFFTALGSALEMAKLKLHVFNLNVKLAGGGLKGLSTVVATTATSLSGMIGIFAALTTVITLVNGAIKAHREEVSALNQATIDTANSASDSANSLFDLYNNYKILSDVTKLTTEQEQEYQSVQERLLPLLNDKNNTLRNLKVGTDEYKNAVAQLTEEEMKNLEAKIKLGEIAAKEELQAVGSNLKVRENIESIKKQADLINGMKGLKDSLGSIDLGKLTIKPPEDSEGLLNYYDQLQEELNGIMETSRKTGDVTYEQNEYFKALVDTMNELSPAVEAYRKQSQQVMEIESQTDVIEYLKNSRVETVQQYRDMIDAIAEKNKYSQEEKEILSQLAETYYPELAKLNEEVTDGVNSYAEAIRRMSGEFDSTDPFDRLVRRLDGFDERLADGSITFKEYIDAMQTEAENLDFEATFGDNLQGASATFLSFFETVMNGFDDITSKAQDGAVGMYEYMTTIADLSGYLSTLTDVLQSNSDSWVESDANTKAFNDSLDEAQNNLQSSVAELRSYEQAVFSLSTIMQDGAKLTAEEYDSMTKDVAVKLMDIVNDHGLMADEIKNKIGSTTSQIAQGLTNNISNQSVAAQAIAANSQTAMGAVAKNIEKLINGIGAMVKKFKATINIGIEGLSFEEVPLEIGGKKLASMKLPKLKFAFSGAEFSGVSSGEIANLIAGSMQGLDFSFPELSTGDTYKSGTARQPAKEKKSGGSKEKKGDSWYDIEVEKFERLNKMGQKTSDQVVEFYKKMSKSGKLSAEERKKAEDSLFNAIKKDIQETSKLQIDELSKQKDALTKTYDGMIKTLNEQKKLIAENSKLAIDGIKEQIKGIESNAQSQIDSLKAVEKENDRIRAKEEYLRNRQAASEELYSAKSRSGIEARRAEKEAKKKIEDLDRQWKEKLESFDLEDKIQQINDIKDNQVKNLEEQIKTLEGAAELETEKIDSQIKLLETVKENTIANIDAQAEHLTNKFNETNVNMMSYGATYSNEIYKKYEDNFILPMANGMVDGFQQANQLFKDMANINSTDIYSSYKTNFIEPMKNDLTSLFDLSSNLAIAQSQIQSPTRGIEKTYVQSVSSADNSKRMESNITNNNYINSGTDMLKLARRTMNEISNAFFRLP